jgi:hypothetical protein
LIGSAHRAFWGGNIKVRFGFVMTGEHVTLRARANLEDLAIIILKYICKKEDAKS